MKKICDAAISLLESGESFVQATVLQSSGSTPCVEGACMLILRDGSIRGTVGGGALEGGVIRAAAEVMQDKQAKVIDVVLDGNDITAPDVICGGATTVLVDHISAGHPGNLEFFTALRAALHSGKRARIVTSPPIHGGIATRSQCLLVQDGVPLGTNGFDPAVAKILEERRGGYDVFTGLDSFGVYFHSAGADGTAYIFGAGHCGEKLAHILATVGFGTVVIDDRPEFANAGRFPEADGIIVPETMDLPFNTKEMGADSYIIIVTRGHVYDELVLRCALRTPAGYIGMIGSRRKRDAIYANLLAEGFAQSDIDRVYSPIGLDIGADTPEEIAVSIAAELIQVRAGKR